MAKNEKEGRKKIHIGIYADEIPTVMQMLDEQKHELIGEELNGKDIRTYFGLKPTHREGIKGELKAEIKELSVEQQRELLAEIKKRKEETAE